MVLLIEIYPSFITYVFFMLHEIIRGVLKHFELMGRERAPPAVQHETFKKTNVSKRANYFITDFFFYGNM